MFESESSPDMFVMMKAMADAYPAAYQTLYEAKPITCSVTGIIFDAIPAPSAAVLDVSQFNWYVTCHGRRRGFQLMFALYVFTSSFSRYLNYVLLEQ